MAVVPKMAKGIVLVGLFVSAVNAMPPVAPWQAKPIRATALRKPGMPEDKKSDPLQNPSRTLPKPMMMKTIMDAKRTRTMMFCTIARNFEPRTATAKNNVRIATDESFENAATPGKMAAAYETMPVEYMERLKPISNRNMALTPVRVGVKSKAIWL